MLTGEGILCAYEERIIHIDPFYVKNLGPNSYDVSIGNWIIRYKQHTGVVDISSSDVFYNFDEPIYYSSNIIIGPNERILCHTQEYIGSYSKYVPCIATRSTAARWGLDVCGSAGFGDIGYVNRWTLELINLSPNPLSIPVGAKIAQVFFTLAEGNVDQVYEGKYNTKVEDWKPEDMLPKFI
jgi:dCTP deaminase